MKSDRNLRRLAFVLPLMMFTLPACADGQAAVAPPTQTSAGQSEMVTVEQLEHALAGKHRKRDKEVAAQLGGLELTERLSTARLERLKAGLPGERARLALVALADASAFLDLPAKEILPNAAPDAAAQEQIISQATAFASSTVSRLPNFFAAETTTRFQDMKVSSGLNPRISFLGQGYFVMDKRSATVTYRNGQEVLEVPVGAKNKGGVSSTAGLTTQGVFGPLLDVAMGNILHGKMTWGHWEQGPAGPMAVFRFAVPKDKSKYSVRYCCIQLKLGVMREFRSVPGYHGEIAIDPASGAVLRLVLKTELRPSLPMKRSDQLVEYGPVEIGGRTYICPLKSISITKAKALVFRESASDASSKDKSGSSADDNLKQAGAASEPAVTAINDIVFDNYHLFRSEVRILSEDSAEKVEKAPESVSAAVSETGVKR